MHFYTHFSPTFIFKKYKTTLLNSPYIRLANTFLYFLEHFALGSTSFFLQKNQNLPTMCGRWSFRLRNTLASPNAFQGVYFLWPQILLEIQILNLRVPWIYFSLALSIAKFLSICNASFVLKLNIFRKMFSHFQLVFVCM